MTAGNTNEVNTAAANSEEDTEAAGGEDIYGADGDAGMVRAENQQAGDAGDDNATDTASDGREPVQP